MVSKHPFTRGWLWAGLVSAMFCGCTAHKQPSRVETALANMAKDVVIPIEATRNKDPLPNNEQVIQQGQAIFVRTCALCHGPDGHGRTELGRNMYPPAMDMTSPHVQHWSDAELFWIIQNGVRLTGMPSWKSAISAADTWKLARFIHDLPRRDASESRNPSLPATSAATSKAEMIRYGRILYRQEGCFMCHQLDGEGGKVGPDLTLEGTRGRNDAWLLGHFRNPPAYTPGSIMPPFKNLTSEQLQALVAFLQNQKRK